MASTELTAKQSAFCVEYLKDKNGKQAAIRAGYSEASASVAAAKLQRHPLIRERINLATAEVAEAAKVDLATCFARLETAYRMALAKANIAGMIGAVNSMADLAGLKVSRHEDVVARAQLEAELAQRAELRTAAEFIGEALVSYDLPASATPAQLIGAATQHAIVTPELFRLLHERAKLAEEGGDERADN